MGEGENTTAIIICSYNMPEATDALVEHLHKFVNMPYDLYVVDNGSDLVEPSKYTTIHLEENVQMIPGFLAGFDIIDHLKIDYEYYWPMTTSCKFQSNNIEDPLEIMLETFEEDPLAFEVHPAMDIDYGAWVEMMRPRKGGPRRVFGVEGICPIYRASMFDELGRWRKELTYGWGHGPELDYLARKRGWHIYIDDRYVMNKYTWVGYHMDRMNMTAKSMRFVS